MPLNMPFRNAKDALMFQLHVYRHARKAIVENTMKSVLDIGCGNPQKLRAFIYPFIDDITGVDLPEIIDQIKMEFGTWIECDLNKDDLDLDRDFDVIIAADVIEHLESPKNLFRMLKRHANSETMIIISTPEKVTTEGNNPSHHREYEKDELNNILEASGFEIKNVQSIKETRSKTPYISNMFTCFIKATK